MYIYSMIQADPDISGPRVRKNFIPGPELFVILKNVARKILEEKLSNLFQFYNRNFVQNILRQDIKDMMRVW